MLKSLTIALALSATNSPAIQNDETKVESVPESQIAMEKGYKRRGGLIVIPAAEHGALAEHAQDVAVVKGYKRRGGLIVIPVDEQEA